MATTSESLIFHIDDLTFRIDKYLGGEESIAGISLLTNVDNYALAFLTDETGEEKQYLILDSINTVLSVDELEAQPYFHLVSSCERIFGRVE